MKRFYYIAAAALAALSVFSCQQKSDPVPSGSQSTFRIVQSESTIPPGGGSCTLSFEATESVSASTDRNWCTATVSGNKVTVTAEPNLTNESRYSLVFLKSGAKTLQVSILQFGEVLSGLDKIADVTAPVEGREVTYDVVSNVEIVMETGESWIHPSFADGKLTIVVDRNDEPRTRFGEVTYSAGSESGSFSVMQYPELKREDNWVLTEGTPSYHYPEFETSASLSAGAEDLYLLYLVPVSEVEGDVGDYVFDVLAVDARNEILKKMEEAPETEFKDYLLNGPDPVKLADIRTGENYLIALGFGANGYVTGQYQYKKITIDDVRPAYYKWLGQWKVPRGSTDAVDTWTVEANVMEASFKVYGFGGFAADRNVPGAFVAIVAYDAKTEEMVFRVYENTGVSWTDATRGPMNALLSGQYTNVAGTTYYTSSINTVICRAKLQEDGTATLTGGTVTSGGAPATFHNMRWYGRYTTASGSRSGVAYDKTETLLPTTMTPAD